MANPAGGAGEPARLGFGNKAKILQTSVVKAVAGRTPRRRARGSSTRRQLLQVRSSVPGHGSLLSWLGLEIVIVSARLSGSGKLSVTALRVSVL